MWFLQPASGKRIRALEITKAVIKVAAFSLFLPDPDMGNTSGLTWPGMLTAAVRTRWEHK